MIILSKVKRSIEKFSGLRIFKNLPLGCDLIYDIKKKLEINCMNIIVDVGANIGQSQQIFAKAFPAARIYCFEPVLETFEKLKKNVIGHNTHCICRALGEEEKMSKMYLNIHGNHLMNSLNPNTNSTNNNIVVSVTTLDRFTKENNIKRINFLKIDTEGWDIKVLLGGKQLLKEMNIDIIQIEAGIHPENISHARFQDISSYLFALNYYIFVFSVRKLTHFSG